MTPTDACATPIIDRIKRLIRDLEAGAILGYDGPQAHWSTRMGAEASSEVARLLSAALAVEAGTDVEPYGYAFQHEETGLQQVVDVQQVEWGFEKNNPRWQKLGPVYMHPPALTTSPASSDTCQRCQGNGEIVTDWERYKHPHEGDKGDPSRNALIAAEQAIPTQPKRTPPLSPPRHRRGWRGRLWRSPRSKDCSAARRQRKSTATPRIGRYSVR